MALSNRFRFYLGTGVTGQGFHITNGEERLETVLERTAKVYGGFTLTKSEGGWTNEKGVFVREPSVIIEVLEAYPLIGDDHEVVNARANDHAQWIGKVFDQESVLLTTEVVSSDFVESYPEPVNEAEEYRQLQDEIWDGGSSEPIDEEREEFLRVHLHELKHDQR
jgi:hypothetical protein